MLTLVVAGCAAPMSAPAETAPPSAAGPLQRARPSGAATVVVSAPSREVKLTVQEYPVPRGSAPHDVAPAPDGGVWYTAQRSGELGRLDPVTGATRHVKLGQGSAPHGVIVGPDGAPWITDGGANLNTAVFDRRGRLWFTGQSGVYGQLDPKTGAMEVFDAPRGRGPYGITVTPNGVVFYASLAGSHLARIDIETGKATAVTPPTPEQGARRAWSDSQGRVWVSEWNAGQVAVYDPAAGSWREWRLPGSQPQAYAVYVDNQDIVWLSDFGGNALVRFDSKTEAFQVVALPSSPANVRQILGRPGEVWGAESGVDKLVVVRTEG